MEKRVGNEVSVRKQVRLMGNIGNKSGCQTVDEIDKENEDFSTEYLGTPKCRCLTTFAPEGCPKCF